MTFAETTAQILREQMTHLMNIKRLIRWVLITAAALAVPASATHSATNATTIAGDGRRLRMRLIRKSPFFEFRTAAGGGNASGLS